MRLSVLLVVLLVSSGASAACFEQAAARYGVSPQLLCAVARCESNLKPTAVNRDHVSRTGTVDLGLMQINSGHLPWLSKFGIKQEHLFDACTNVHVGAYLLAERMQKYGDSWEAVGAYNASCSTLKGDKCTEARTRYAWCVHRRLSACSSLPALPAAPIAVPVAASAAPMSSQ